MTLKTQTKLDHALELARQGLNINPINPLAKTPRTAWKTGGPGQQATTDPTIIREWWMRCPNANIAIATGPSKLLVIDIDVKKGKEGNLAYMMLDLDHVPIPRTRQVRTPSGGWHDYFKVDTPVPGTINLLKDRIGTGIDIKCADGYVLAPGSELPEGVYQWVDPHVPIAPAPVELLALLTPHREQSHVTEPGSFTPEQLAAMLEWLDPTNFKDHDEWLRLMCACHHATGGAGVEEFVEWSIYDPEYADDDEKIRYRWGTLGKKSNRAEMVTERTLIKYVLEAGGTIPGERAEDDFEAVVDSPMVPKRFWILDQLKHLPSLSWLIGGLIPESSFGMLVGEPGTFKSFFALHAALCVANGRACFGRPVRQGDTFYLAGESAFGYRLRTMAWEQHIGYSVSQPPFYLQVGGSHLNQGGEVRKLAEDILTLSPNPKLIIIDTVQVYLSGNENSPDNMGSFVKACLSLRDLTGAAVLVIHHLGKDVTKGARGHTSLIGAADFIFKTVKKESSIEVVCQKMKEADGHVRMFLEPLVVTVDPGGEFPDSLILRETQRPVDDETTSILRLAKEFDGRGQGVFVKSVEEDLNIRDAYRKVKKMIPEGKHNAIDFEDGSLWIEPDPDNPQGVKTIRYERDFAETDADISDLLA